MRVAADGARGGAGARLVALQRPDGAWEGEMVGNTLLLSQYVLAQRIVGSAAVDADTRAAMVRHYRLTRTAAGGWGMHPESGPYLLLTALAYVALRLLGLPADHELVEPARRWLRAQPGGVTAIPSWGKLWLALVGLYEYEGMNPLWPELFTLPRWLPLHPDHYYCHVRYTYLAMAYLYGRRFRVDLGPLGARLRRELYGETPVRFAAARHALAVSDVYAPPGRALRLGYDLMARLEPLVPARLRQRALARCIERVRAEMRASDYEQVGPIICLLSTVALYAHEGRSPEVEASLAGLERYRWQDAAEGLRLVGARSTSWDTAFALRALAATRAPGGAVSADEHALDAAIGRGHAWLTRAQVTEELPAPLRRGRDRVRGGWCFADGRQRWPVSDCTAEALSALLVAEELPGVVPAAARLSDGDVAAALGFVCARQNRDGGFGTYERRRGGPLLDALNPSELYGRCMTERSYVECTASAVAMLARARRLRPGACDDASARALARGVAWLRSSQRADGSWSGFWGINFTYAIFHAVEALAAAGVPPRAPPIARALAWLLGHQKIDGGWGEHWSSCLCDRYIEHPESQVLMTSWALLALGHGGSAPLLTEARARAAELLRRRRRADGSFPEEAVAGVFFCTGMLHYRMYKEYFPIWALARYDRASLNDGNAGLSYFYGHSIE